MAITAAQLVTKVSIDGDTEAKAKLDSMGQSVDHTSSKMGDAMLGAAALVGAGLLALGVSATKMAGDYNAGLTSIVTGAGESEKNLGMVHDALLKMSVDTATSTKQLTDGLYMIESAGFHGAAGLDVLKAAAEGAKVGNADLGTVADGVSTIMVDYAKSGITAAQATNLLVATVASGKTHMTELAASLAVVLPTASAVGVQLRDVAGAMATMTGEGVPAADAATYLRQMLMALDNPASKSVAVLKEIGLTASDVADGMKRSLPDTLQLIEDHLKQKFPEGSSAYVKALSEIAGGTKQMQGLLDLTGDHLHTFEDNVKGITASVKDGGNAITGWALVQKDFNFKLDQTHEMFNTVMVTLGEQLMPVLDDFMTHYVQPLIQEFGDWTAHSSDLHDTVQGLSETLGVLLVDGAGLVQFMTSANPLAILLRDTLAGLLAVVAAQKIAGMVNDFKLFLFSTSDFVMNAGPRLLDFFGVGFPAKTAIAAASETAIGVTAKTTMAADVALGATEAEASIEGIGTTADATAAQVGTAGAAMQGALATAASFLGPFIALLGAGVAVQGIPENEDPIKQFASWSADQTNKAIAAALALMQGPTSDAEAQYLSNSMSQAVDKAQGPTNATVDTYLHNMIAETTKTLADDNQMLLAYELWLNGASTESWQQFWTDFQKHMQPLMDEPVAKVAVDVDTTQIDLADAKVQQMKNIMQHLNDPVAPVVDTRSVDAAISKVMYLKSQLDDTGGGGVSFPYPAQSTPGHATGIMNSPYGHMATVGEQGPETMWIPKGASVFPHGSGLPGNMSSGGGPLHIHVHVAGYNVATAILPDLAQVLRTGLATVGV